MTCRLIIASAVVAGLTCAAVYLLAERLDFWEPEPPPRICLEWRWREVPGARAAQPFSKSVEIEILGCSLYVDLAGKS